MKPLDPRLLRHARSARGYLALTVALGIVTAALVVAQALLLAHALGRAAHDEATLHVLAPTIGWIFLGRTLSGISGAAVATATAYITDISEPAKRAQRFGLFHAMFGVGFILGPVLGGFLGEAWTRAPFLAAAALNGVNFLMAVFVLPESHRSLDEARGKPFDRAAFNPFASLRWATAFPALLPLMAAFVLLAIVGEVGGTIWVLYGEDKFHWDPWTIGFSLAGFGVFTALAQAFTGPGMGTEPAIQRRIVASWVSSSSEALARQPAPHSLVNICSSSRGDIFDLRVLHDPDAGTVLGSLQRIVEQEDFQADERVHGATPRRAGVKASVVGKHVGSSRWSG